MVSAALPTLPMLVQFMLTTASAGDTSEMPANTASAGGRRKWGVSWLEAADLQGNSSRAGSFPPFRIARAGAQSIRISCHSACAGWRTGAPPNTLYLALGSKGAGLPVVGQETRRDDPFSKESECSVFLARQRRCVLEPRVARHALPWVGVARCTSTPTGLRPVQCLLGGNGRNRVAVQFFPRRFPG